MAGVDVSGIYSATYSSVSIIALLDATALSTLVILPFDLDLTC